MVRRRLKWEGKGREQIQQKMQENHLVMQEQMKPRGSTRQGAAMLAGLVRCGKCGHAMRVAYKDNRFQYVCSKGRSELDQTSCQFLSGSRIDDAVLTAFFEAIRPANIDALQRDVGFRPSTPIEDGVKKFVAWYKSYHQL